MLATPVKDYKDNIELIENSGIQFLDYEFKIDWDNKKDPLFQRFGLGRFMQDSGGDDWDLIRLVPDEKGETFSNPFDPELIKKADQGNFLDIPTKQSLKLYNGVWFPIPFFAQNGERKDGPLNWVRARIVQQKKKANEEFTTYRVVIAFDTNVT